MDSAASSVLGNPESSILESDSGQESGFCIFRIPRSQFRIPEFENALLQ